MARVRYLILGAGPSGLAFAHTLLAQGEKSFVVLEKEAVAGGLCRSEMVDGKPLDIGGGHFLDVRKPEVLNLIFEFLPEQEWTRFNRVATIRLRGMEIEHPLEANLWQLPVDAQADFLESIAQTASVRGVPMPAKFEDWIRWKFGARIADEYMLPYNRKIWGMDLNRLGTYWLYKLPSVSFRETLLSCLKRNAQGALPAHGTFYYPKRHGYGEVWKRMGEALGERLQTATPITEIDLASRRVNRAFEGDVIVNTVPWTIWMKSANLPPEISSAIGELAFIGIDVTYHPQSWPTKSHWVYEPDEAIMHHRVLCRSNFCANSRGHWTETNSRRSQTTTATRYRNEFAYPVNTVRKLEAVENICQWAHRGRILPLGRWGLWEHMNSDVAVADAISAAKKIMGNNN